MRILVLGSEGFIGGHAVKYFGASGHKVISADIVLKQGEDYLLINPEMPGFSDVFLKQRFDVCINATGAANVQFSFAYPQMDFILNTGNVFNILEGIRQYNSGCKFINLSSAAVYGNPESLPIDESAQLQPLSPYGYHKMYSEQICKEFHTLFGVSTVSLRIFSAYGEGLRKQLFWDLYQKVSAADDVIELYGTGKESRDFIYINDIMHAMSCVIEKGIFDGKVINVASGIESTIEDSVKLFLESMNKKVHVNFVRKTKVGDPINWKANIDLLKSFGFENKYSLREGINNYCQWLTGKR